MIARRGCPDNVISDNGTDPFWQRWRKEYVVNLREFHKLRFQNRHQQQPSIGDVVVVYEDKLPTQWRIGVIEQLHNNRGATVITQRSGITGPVNLLHPIELFYSKERSETTTDKNPTNEQLQHERPRREAAVRGEIKPKFCG